MDYKISVNNQFEFNPNQKRLDNFDFIQDSDGTFHVLENGQSYKVMVEQVNYAEKTFSFRINGSIYEVKLEDQFDQLVNKMGLNAVKSKKINAIKAPMPGLVLDVLVEVGQEVVKGDSICILEAMKMENVIKSIGDGTVKDIRVEKGNAVEKGQLMIEME